MVTDKEIQCMIDYIESKLRRGVSREEAFETLVGAGILDWDGNYTRPYRDMLIDAGIEV